MNLLRSVFITLFVAYVTVLSILGLVQLLRGAEPVLSWLGLALAALGPLAFFAWIYLAGPARTERHPVEFSVVSGLGLAICLASAWRHGPAAGVAHAWAGLALVGWLVYLRWYSGFSGRPSPMLAPGSLLPTFRLQKIDGEYVDSSLFRGRPHVLLFYRGNWCPFCTAQIRELAAAYGQLEARGARIILISPQPRPEHRRLASRFDLPLWFMRDPANEAARRLGIVSRWGLPMGLQALGYESDSVMPTVVITDPEGVIIFAHETDHYRRRPEPQAFLDALDAIG